MRNQTFDPAQRFGEGETAYRTNETLHRLDPASQFEAFQQGSNVRLVSNQLNVILPVGTVGVNLAFAEGDERQLYYDASTQMVHLGSQVNGTTPAELVTIGEPVHRSTKRNGV